MDFKVQELPLTRIKKIMKQDEEVEGTPKFVRTRLLPRVFIFPDLSLP